MLVAAMIMLVTAIPLVIGACGETKEDFQDVLKVCARMAVGRGDAVYMYVSPIFEAEVKDEAYCICHLTPLSSSDCRCHCPRSLSTQEIATALCSRLEKRGC